MTDNKLNDIEANDSVKFLAPDYSLKKAIGEDVDIRDIFNEDNIEKAQGAIDKHKDSFLEWSIQDIGSLSEYYANASADIEKCGPMIIEIEKVASIIKSRAGTFGYELATLVAKSLSRFCALHTKINAEHMIVIGKHIDTLSVVFTKRITGDGGAVGKELLDNLAKLVEKYN